MQIAILGLGKMGSRMASKLLKEGHDVVVWNRSEAAVEEFKIQNSKFKIESQKLQVASSIENAMTQLETPRVVWIMLPAGDATEEVLVEVEKFVEKGDIVIDGANSKFTDTERRFERLTEKGIKFLGIGVSGGVIASEKGYPLMVGGDKSGYEYVRPILDSLAHPHGGHEYFGTGGAGHFVKMVHNGIEYPYMQAIGEGFGILEKSPYGIDLVKAAKLYQKGTLISGFMMDRTVEALENDHKLESIQGIIGSASGETVWTIEEAKKHNLPVESIEQAQNFRIRSETEKAVQDSFAAKMVGALRIAFGGHPVKKK